MRQPTRLRISWQDDNTMKMEADAGTQTRLFHFGDWKVPGGAPTIQGDTTASWETGARGRGAAANQPPPMFGNLKTVTKNLKPGYLRKNGVPYGDKAVLTEYFNLLSGEQNDTYIAITAMVDDSTYLTQPFVRTYNFKKLADATGWDPTPCWNR